MSAIEALFIVSINLLSSAFLISILYILVIQPMQKILESLGAESQRQSLQQKDKHIALGFTPPSNMLPSMDDIPMDLAYGEEEPDYSTIDEVANDLVEQSKYNQLELEDNNAWKQLQNLKTNAEAPRVHN